MADGVTCEIRSFSLPAYIFYSVWFNRKTRSTCEVETQMELVYKTKRRV